MTELSVAQVIDLLREGRRGRAPLRHMDFHLVQQGAEDLLARYAAQETAALRDELKREREQHLATREHSVKSILELDAEVKRVRAVGYELVDLESKRTAERDAATAELAHVRVELVAAQSELQALADAHAELVKAFATLSDENARLQANNNNLATAILHGSERGQS